VLKASSYYLDDLLSQGLIYCEPSRELNFGSRRHRLCLQFDSRSHTDISALKGSKCSKSGSTVGLGERNSGETEFFL
jgi:hypothetical protein